MDVSGAIHGAAAILHMMLSSAATIHNTRPGSAALVVCGSVFAVAFNLLAIVVLRHYSKRHVIIAYDILHIWRIVFVV